ncbi:Asp-tRNA(Asn)/Glu-tRNA(Gln) amidotransferase subunit GatC [Candidatus Odyssella acanthamoebae]|uniref:Aspartyl/glutamyl-tRNA(Asn/Gln) amidotransferase subunit C n=1 Tax=Candidatus Odyssella acanthamoebae TaxID=91604 RepID=A0A077AWN1_9PROT|nr:Asp-tRNA(Asn)/Glu-tRNA(Gln) amidotransferase subunit GatC [Candidatus Paracaedibacter acanthamoebae]AIK96043.1 glutamyl-tRNA amidotransferase [Candidatus Paracaedibacter acanthamoebae]
MSLTRENVAKVAKLARIRLEEAELDAMKVEINGILNWIDHLQQVNTDGVDIFSEQQEQHLPERPDIVDDGNIVDAILANAPEKTHGMFAVPKVVE